jgi:hypothetical protein
MLEKLRALDVIAAVQAGGEAEMSVKQSARLAK